ncbi:MAG TPA: DNA-3-methyladenine glycosylase [Streptosporangiaceae bacterium]|nr:DNA-3-methyladenine glycosylase [Streptosporangiaceae bacterium]
MTEPQAPRADQLWPGRILDRGFFDRPGLEVAPELLGLVLWHDSPAGLVAAVLTEVEAYAGLADPASHAYRGKSARNAVMFGPPGHAYVYFTYGMHFCMNLVCEQAGQASAVLLRAGRVVTGTDLAAGRRQPRARRAAPAGDTGAPESAGVAGATGGADGAAPVEGAGSVEGAEAAEPGREVLPARAASPGRARRVLAERDLARGPARLCQALGVDRSLDGADVCGTGTPLGIGAPPGWAPAAASEISTGPRVGVSQAAEVPWRFWLTREPTVSVYRRSVPRRRAR